MAMAPPPGAQAVREDHCGSGDTLEAPSPICRLQADDIDIVAKMLAARGAFSLAGPGQGPLNFDADASPSAASAASPAPGLSGLPASSAGSQLPPVVMPMLDFSAFLAGEDEESDNDTGSALSPCGDEAPLSLRVGSCAPRGASRAVTLDASSDALSAVEGSAGFDPRGGAGSRGREGQLAEAVAGGDVNKTDATTVSMV